MYSRKVNGQILTFGHEGILYKNSFILYDKQTSSLWVHTTGEALRGPLKGKRLAFVPSTVTSWSKWKAEHPNTKVLVGRHAKGFMGTFSLKRNRKLFGISIGQGDAVKLFPFELLEKQRVIHDELSGKKIVVTLDAESGSATAFESGDLQFNYKDGKILDQKGRVWNLFLGKSGEEQLKPIPATPWLIERWNAFYSPQEKD